MPQTWDFDSGLMKPVRVEDTKQLEPNATSPTVYEVGNNNTDRDETKHGPFGKLGGKGLPK